MAAARRSVTPALPLWGLLVLGIGAGVLVVIGVLAIVALVVTGGLS